MFIEAIGQHSIRQRVVHDIFGAPNDTSSIRLDHEQLYRKFAGTILIIAHHGDHYHIVHDCSYSNNSCRCAFYKCLDGKIGRRFNRRVVPSWKYSIMHWVHLAIYFEKDSRHYLYLGIAGRTWIPSSETRCVRLRKDLQKAKERLVEGSEFSIDVHSAITCRSEIYGDNEINTSSLQTDSGNSRNKKGGTGQQIITFIKNFPTAPTSHILNTTIWLTSKFKFMDTNSVLIKNCLRIVNNNINNLSFIELYNHYEHIEPQNLIFNAPVNNVYNYYYSIDDSLELLNNILMYQFNNNTMKIIEFLTNLYNVINKSIPKKNSIFVLSPPNAGKNLFFDTFIHYCLNFGQLGNFNRYSSFPMMECVDKRIILWNEPVLESSAAETLKMLFGGDTVVAKIKYAPDAVIMRTPVIILSNNDVFPNDKAFRSRMYTYKWKTFNALKNYKKKPHPLSCYKLLKKYNLLNKN